LIYNNPTIRESMQDVDVFRKSKRKQTIVLRDVTLDT